jgi:hypothetical protein
LLIFSKWIIPRPESSSLGLKLITEHKLEARMARVRREDSRTEEGEKERLRTFQSSPPI